MKYAQCACPETLCHCDHIVPGLDITCTPCFLGHHVNAITRPKESARSRKIARSLSKPPNGANTSDGEA